MSTPTLKELIEKATPGEWLTCRIGTPESLHHAYGVACCGDYFVESDSPAGSDKSDAELIARCNPATMAKVVDALEAAANGNRVTAVNRSRDALNLLNGKPAQ